MKPRKITITPTAADRNGISAAQTPSGAGNLTITGALASGGVATLSPPAHVSIYSDGDESGDTYTITGTNRYGNTITEAITGPNTTTVKGTKNFATVTQVAVSGAGTGNIEVGSADELETAWNPVEWRGRTDTHVEEGSSADMTYVVQYTMDPTDTTFDEDSADPHEGDPDHPIMATRIKITAYVAGSLYLTIVSNTDG